MKNNKKITKFKYENVIFIVLVLMSTFNATLIASDGLFGVYSAIITLLVQIGMWELVRYGIRYIRKNPQEVSKSIKALFEDN